MRRKICLLLIFVLTAGLCGCGAKAESAEIIVDESIEASETALVLSASDNTVIEGSCDPGSLIHLTAESENVRNYDLMTKHGSEPWKIEKRNISGDIIIKAPSDPCFYSVRLCPKGKDSQNNMRSFLITVKKQTGKKLEDNGSRLSAHYLCLGDNEITAAPSFKGGTPPYKYTYKLVNASEKAQDLLDMTSEDISRLTFSTTPGRYELSITASDSDGNKAEKRIVLVSDYHMPMKNIYQYTEPALPTGCEATALASCLNYYGCKVTKNEIADKYIKKVPFTFKDGEFIGGDPEVEFAGDPNSENAYGCFSGCIIDAANSYFESTGADFVAKRVRFDNLEQMHKLMEKGQPVLIWSTMFLWESVVTDSWKTKDGKQIDWLCNEHCFVLTGMSPSLDQVYVSDPMTDSDKPLYYDAKKFMHYYKKLGSHAVVIEPILR